MTPEERLELIRSALKHADRFTSVEQFAEEIGSLLPPPPRTDKEKLAEIEETVKHWEGHWIDREFYNSIVRSLK